MAPTVYSIQVLRALAATLVAIVHLGRALQLKAGIDPTPVTFNGGVGVDLFFVVSGFVMAHVTPRPFPAGAFLLRRAARIAPLYWLLTFCYGMALLAGASRLNSFKLDNFLSAFVFVPCYGADGNVLPPLEQGWTLAYEMFFYVCFALASRIAFRRRAMLLGAAFALLAAAGAAIPPGSNALLVTYSNPILLEFALGCVFGTLYERGRLPLAAPRAVALAGLAALGVAASPFLMAQGWPRAICWGAPAGATVWAFLQLERSVDFRRMRLAQTLGDASYSIYLTHVLTLSVLALAFRFEPARGAAAWLLAPAFLAVALLAGVLCRRLVERPLTDAARRLLGAGPAVSGGAARGRLRDCPASRAHPAPPAPAPSGRSSR